MVKFLFLSLLMYFFFRFIGRIIFGTDKPTGMNTETFNQYNSIGQKEKDISDKVKIIKD